MLLTLRGTPFIYYGEEIGMSGAKPDEQIRTPMQWSDDEGAGFTSGVPWEAINADYQDVNVEIQTGDNASLLEHYRKLIQLRNEHSALQTGDTDVAESESSKLLSYLRADDEEAILVLINMDDQPVTNYDINLETGPLSGNYTVTSLMDDSAYSPLQANARGGFDRYIPLEEVPPYSVILLILNRQ